jgi:hypothetical protein
MKRRAQVRRVFKWLGTGLCVLIAGVWISSAWWFARISPTAKFKERWFNGEPIPNPYEGLYVGGGRIGAMWVRRSKREEFAKRVNGSESPDKPAELPWLWVQSTRDPPVLRLDAPWMNDAGSSQRKLFLTCWIPLVVVAIPTALLWHRDRRAHPAGHCRTCGYNLTGNVSGRCPECGEVIERTS